MIFNDIPNYEEYDVSREGVVRLKKTNYVLLAGQALGRGLPSVTLYPTGKPQCRISIAKLVLLAHVGEPPDANFRFPIYLNNDITDHRVENLQWSTHGEAAKRGRLRNAAKGFERQSGRPRKPRTKLTEEVVREIKFSSLAPAQMARKIGCVASMVSLIRQGVTWAHIVEHPTAFLKACKHCSSTDLVKAKIERWSADEQQWRIDETDDAVTCLGCGMTGVEQTVVTNRQYQ
jgi:hypothetical protein